jgi:hypothetical protein
MMWQNQRDDGWHGVEEELDDKDQIQIFSRQFGYEKPNGLQYEYKKKDYKYRSKCNQECF